MNPRITLLLPGTRNYAFLRVGTRIFLGTRNYSSVIIRNYGNIYILLRVSTRNHGNIFTTTRKYA